MNETCRVFEENFDYASGAGDFDEESYKLVRLGAFPGWREKSVAVIVPKVQGGDSVRKFWVCVDGEKQHMVSLVGYLSGEGKAEPAGIMPRERWDAVHRAFGHQIVLGPSPEGDVKDMVWLFHDRDARGNIGRFLAILDEGSCSFIQFETERVGKLRVFRPAPKA